MNLLSNYHKKLASGAASQVEDLGFTQIVEKISQEQDGLIEGKIKNVTGIISNVIP